MSVYKAEEEKEEKERLIMATTKVVEYLEPLMSRELLYKFPDNSAFDFDYTQSSIWSPLVPHPHSPMDLNSITPRKLSFGLELELGNMKCLRKVTSIIKKKINVNLLKMKNKKKMRASEFSPTPMKGTCYPATTKAWTKVLKAASKHFKKRKKKDPTAHVMIPSNYLRDGNISR